MEQPNLEIKVTTQKVKLHFTRHASSIVNHTSGHTICFQLLMEHFQ